MNSMDLRSLLDTFRNDYSARLTATQTAMKRDQIDVLALSGAVYHRFLAAVNGLPVLRPIWLVVPPRGRPTFVSPRCETKEIQSRCDTPVEVDWIEWEEPGLIFMTHQDALVECINRIAPNALSVGVDFGTTWGGNVELVRQALGPERIKDVTLMMRELLSCKDATAINAIRQCCDIAPIMFWACHRAVKPGVEEWRVALAGNVAGTERAATLWARDEEQSLEVESSLMMGAGPHRGARCHSAAAGRQMQEGEILGVCFCGPSFFGHAIGFDWPFRVGSDPLSEPLQTIVDVARLAQEAALAVIRPGAKAAEVHAAAAAVIEGMAKREGWANPFLHRTGRGIGYSDHDGPEPKAGSVTVLEVDMVMTVESGFYVDGVGGARFGDTVLVTEKGCEVLTPFELGRNP